MLGNRTEKLRFGVIGAGNMGEAIIRGFVKSANAKGVDLCVFDACKEKAEALAKELNLLSANTLEELIDWSEVLLVAIKPNICSHVFSEQFDRFSRQSRDFHFGRVGRGEAEKSAPRKRSRSARHAEHARDDRRGNDCIRSRRHSNSG